jgi:hypothetical protein
MQQETVAIPHQGNGSKKADDAPGEKPEIEVVASLKSRGGWKWSPKARKRLSARMKRLKAKARRAKERKTIDVKKVVERPKHYTSHPSGVECITITEHMNFCIGNAMKYLWRAESKGDTLTDLRKAMWYIKREIERVSYAQGQSGS